MKNIYTLIAVFFLGTGLCIAQAPFTFTNANYRLQNPHFHSGVAVAVADMDRDGMDDIARMNQGYDLYYELQHTNKQFDSLHIVSFTNSTAWSMVVGDPANIGKRGVASGAFTAQIVTPDSTFTVFTMVTLPYSNFFQQNMNFADMNNDGWIDLWADDDDATSTTWGNDHTGNFPDTTFFFNRATTPASDNSGNYGSLWADVNNDGFVDFMDVHCRQGVDDTADPRRRNQLFMNDGHYNYIDDWQDTRGLRIAAESWTCSFEDIDNDGDLDAVITCQDIQSQLFTNNGSGYFTNITTGSGFNVDVLPIESKMEDFDNDGFVDILITGSDSRMYHNNGDHTFTMVPLTFDNNQMESFATGDLNHDGQIDVYGSYAQIYTSPTNIDDVLWLNTTNNGNHFVTIDLQGTVSNRDGLGARVTIYGPWGKQIREVRAGESYGTANSFMCHFGLGTATTIDSITVHWPSGIFTQLYNRAVDQFITIIENQCSSPDNAITFNGPSVLCQGEYVTMNANPGYHYLWSTGDTTASITVDTTGEFNVKLIDVSTGCASISKTVTIVSQPNQTPTVTVNGATTFCAGDSVQLQASTSGGYLWSTGDTTQTISVSQPGSYSVAVPGVCQVFGSQPVIVTTVPASVLNVTYGAACLGANDNVTLQASVTGTANWYSTATGGLPLDTGAAFTTPALGTTTTYYVEAQDTLFGLLGNVGAPDSAIGAGIYFTGDQYQIFNVYQPLIIRSLNVYTQSAGSRTIELRDSNGIVIISYPVNVPAGESQVTLNFPVNPGNNYALGWAIGSSPGFFRNSSGAQYPYNVNGLISITSNSTGNNAYWFAYYNWNVIQTPVACVSPTCTAVIATINPNPVVSFTGLASQYSNTDAPATLSGTPAGGTFSGPGISGNSFNPATAGVGGPYAIIYSYADNNGCSGADTLEVSVINSVNGIINVDGISLVHIMPNPNNGSFSLSLRAPDGINLDIVVTNILGQKIYEENNLAVRNPFNEEINLGGVAKGLYYITLTANQKQSTYKLVVE